MPSLPEVSPDTFEMLTKYADRNPDFKGDIKAALEFLMTKHTRPEYLIIAEELKELRRKRLAREEQEFNKRHTTFKKHRNFGY